MNNSISFYLNIIFLIIIIVLIIINQTYGNELDLFNLIKLYEIGENDYISSQIKIRKKDGQTCQITTEFPDQGKLKEYHKKLDKLHNRYDDGKIGDDKFEEEMEQLHKIPLEKFIEKKGDCL